MYLIVTVLTLPAFAVFIAHNMEAAQGDHWALNLRTAATGGSEDDAEVYGGLNVIVWQVTYMLELFCLSRKSWWRITIPALALLAFAFFTMSKWGFLSFFFSTISVLYFKRKIGLRHILIGIVVLFGLFVIIQSLRYAVSTRQLDKSNFVVLYLLSSMSAFDTLLPASSLHWGENTFRAFYSLCNQLGLSPIKPPTGILPFIEKPIETNTYTCMYPFFKDFGYWGVALFATIMGALSGFIFKRAQRGSGFYILLYAVCVNCLIMQYANEMLMTSLFAYIKEWLLLLLPFIATKYHIFSHKTV